MAEAVYTQIADDLRAQIAAGTLRPGDDVPTEAELAERWRTSRGPIRNALAALRGEGLLETSRGRPARVVARKANQAVDVSVPFTRWARELGVAPGAQTQELSLRRAGDMAAALGVEPTDTIVSVVRLRLLDGRAFDAHREYLYQRRPNGFAVLFAERPPRLFHEIALQPGDADGTAWTGTAAHQCSADLYDSHYRFLTDGGFTLRHTVRGPRKDYVSLTRFSAA